MSISKRKTSLIGIALSVLCASAGSSQAQTEYCDGANKLSMPLTVEQAARNAREREQDVFVDGVNRLLWSASEAIEKMDPQHPNEKLHIVFDGSEAAKFNAQKIVANKGWQLILDQYQYDRRYIGIRPIVVLSPVNPLDPLPGLDCKDRQPSSSNTEAVNKADAHIYRAEAHVPTPETAMRNAVERVQKEYVDDVHVIMRRVTAASGDYNPAKPDAELNVLIYDLDRGSYDSGCLSRALQTVQKIVNDQGQWEITIRSGCLYMHPARLILPIGRGCP